MKPKHHDFRSLKNSTFDAMLPPNADPERVGLIAVGNPDVLSEAMGKRTTPARVSVAVA